MEHDVRGKRVLVGLSGGVDSAVSAYLLKKAGAEVSGVFVKGWYPPGMPCTWREERADALRVAAHLSIPFHTLDASEAYKAGVIDYLIQEYKQGRTPNPDVMCNREVKFGVLHEYRVREGYDYLATGHYARASKEGVLMRGIDRSKDQSYFLWAVSQEILKDTLFPVGNQEKSATRRIALEVTLPVSSKRDSQGICFLGNISVSDFLRSEFGEKQGPIVTNDGEVVGTHDGVLLYTRGQKVRLGGAEHAWYVVSKDLTTNTLTVSSTPVPTNAHGIAFDSSNWFSTPFDSELVEAQTRYHGPLTMGTLDVPRGVFLPTAPVAEYPAEGQSIVFYNGECMIGGGIIQRHEA
jgi:tRNA-specific 2-thiouridylase